MEAVKGVDRKGTRNWWCVRTCRHVGAARGACRQGRRRGPAAPWRPPAAAHLQPRTCRRPPAAAHLSVHPPAGLIPSLRSLPHHPPRPRRPARWRPRSCAPWAMGSQRQRWPPPLSRRPLPPMSALAAATPAPPCPRLAWPLTVMPRLPDEAQGAQAACAPPPSLLEQAHKRATSPRPIPVPVLSFAWPLWASQPPALMIWPHSCPLILLSRPSATKRAPHLLPPSALEPTAKPPLRARPVRRRRPSARVCPRHRSAHLAPSLPLPTKEVLRLAAFGRAGKRERQGRRSAPSRAERARCAAGAAVCRSVRRRSPWPCRPIARATGRTASRRACWGGRAAACGAAGALAGPGRQGARLAGLARW